MLKLPIVTTLLYSTPVGRGRGYGEAIGNTAVSSNLVCFVGLLYVQLTKNPEK